MLARISTRDFNEWLAFYNLEPWGSPIESRRAAATPWLLASIYRKPGARAPDFDDFILPRDAGDSPRKTQDPAKMEAIFRAFATAHNKSIASKKGGM